MKITHNKIAPMTKKRRFLMEAANFYAKYLKIQNFDVTVNVVFKYALTDTFRVHAEVSHLTAHRLNITIDADIAQEFGLQILAHEMVHIKQYIKGELSESSNGLQLWKGKTVDIDLPYHKCPWEVEAMKKQVIMMYAFIAYQDKK